MAGGGQLTFGLSGAGLMAIDLKLNGSPGIRCGPFVSAFMNEPFTVHNRTQKTADGRSDGNRKG
jgi:hypothetical protein